MQLFILLYIEGGSYINEEEDTWEFMVLYVLPPPLHLSAQDSSQRFADRS